MIETESQHHRRRVLQAIGGSSLFAIAGCTGSSDGVPDEDENKDEGESTPEPAEEQSDNEELDEEDDEGGESTHTLEFLILSPDRSAKPDAKITGRVVDGPNKFETPRTDENGRTQVELSEETYYWFNLHVCSTDSPHSCNLTQGEFLNVFPSEVVTDDGEGIHLTRDTEITIRELEKPTEVST